MVKSLQVAVALSLLLVVSARVSMNDILTDDENSGQPAFLTPDDFADLHNFREEDIKPVIASVVGASNVDKDPLTRANKFEGDIAGHNKSEIHNFVRKSNYMGRNAIRNRWQLWPEGRIPYMMSSRYGPYSRKTIAKAMEEYHTKTCIRFVPRKSESNYVYIYPEEGCYSLVGRVGGRQPISLDAGCIQVGTIIHEFMHTSGFFHEQSRADRDDYIEIKWGNLLAGAEDQFESYSLRTITHLGTDYDYGSIMHYGAYAFSKAPYSSSGKTIIPKKSGGDKIGQREGFSKNDLYKINKLYQCESQTTDTDDDEDSGVDTDTNSGGSTGGGGTSGGEEDCEDKDWNCFLRPTFGRCSSSRARRNCAKSCGHCGKRSGSSPSGSSGTSGASGGGSSVVSSDCKDKRDHCSDWKTKGYCTKYSSYMTRNCPRICGLCGGSGGRSAGGREEQNRGNEVNQGSSGSFTGECKDRDPHCYDWSTSDKGYCTKHPAFMRKKCPKSCRICNSADDGENSIEEVGEEGGTGGDGAGGTSCTNDNRKCVEYANNGYCTGTNKHVMERYCRKACGLC